MRTIILIFAAVMGFSSFAATGAKKARGPAEVHTLATLSVSNQQIAISGFTTYGKVGKSKEPYLILNATNEFYSLSSSAAAEAGFSLGEITNLLASSAEPITIECTLDEKAGAHNACSDLKILAGGRISNGVCIRPPNQEPGMLNNGMCTK
jgi:hypothetical protein